MGLSSSKHNGTGPSSTSSSPSPSPSPSPSCGGFVRRSRSARSRILNSSRLRYRSSDNEEHQISECSSKENGKAVSCSSKSKLNSCQISSEDYRRVRAEKSDGMNITNSGVELQEWGESSFSNPVSREGNPPRDFSSLLNPTSRFFSHFSFYPGNLSFRLSGANSVGSSGSFSASCAELRVSNEEDKFAGPSNGGGSRIDVPRGWDFLPSCFTNGPPKTQDDNCASDCSSPFLDQFQVNRRSNSVRDALQSRTNTRVESTPNSTLTRARSDGTGIKHGERRTPAREPVDRNVRFSRTLSVGRLRDRVIRRATPSDLEVCNFQQDRGVRLTRHASRRRGSDRQEENATSDDNNDFSQQVSSDNGPSSSSHSFYGGQNNVGETMRAREARYSNLLEHRSHFLERRRRIRSHVRALQRLGSRFENLSGHERSCILSGQHRGGQCNCSTSIRDGNMNDDTNATASISRIVMLAEALFEVLDEINQQSVVLSSRPSVSSIGSIPAPNGVVDSLPLKIFSKLKKKSSEDTAQCYICLVEYEEGDCMRILPCHHEFHGTCIDKWLKEIHRVCPLCRGDVCRLGSLTARN